MVASVLINGALAFGILLAMLYTKVDLDSVATALYPFILILAQGTQSLSAGLTMAAVVAIMQFCACVGSLASSSRIIWSLARDRGLPASSQLSRVSKRSTIPLTAIATALGITMALGLINIGSTKAFDAFLSLLLEALFISYLVALVLLLIGRTTGRVGNNGVIRWGPWYIPGALGVVNNIFACVYLVVICFFAFWPSGLPVTAQSMNYSVVITSAVIVFGSFYYLAFARKVYQGPLVETEAVVLR